MARVGKVLRGLFQFFVGHPLKIVLPSQPITRGTERAIWWRRISSGLGYEPISSPVRYGATEACWLLAIELLFRQRGLDLQYDRIFSFAIGWRRRRGRFNRSGWLGLTGGSATTQ